MLEGLFISLVGMGAVFVSLAVIMFLMMGVERIFRCDGLAVEGMLALGEMGVEVATVGGKEEPEGTVEVAAIALALAWHVKGLGRELGTSITINGVFYQVKVGDISSSPTPVIVNGESYRGAVGEERLPLAKRTGLKIRTQERSAQHGRLWRAAHPPLQGGDYWYRRGWTGR